MDATPAMLMSLENKSVKITPFIGLAENIKGSIKEAKKYFDIPLEFQRSIFNFDASPYYRA
jgi:hypothetical protein